jgi:DNA-binding transcriptional ArsR family regulator
MHKNIYKEYEMDKGEKEKFIQQAEFCKFMANAKRIEIISILNGNEMCVEDIAGKMDLNIPNVSQHLAVMKKKGIVESKRDGVKIYYKISNNKIFQACLVMEELMNIHLKKN